MQEQANDKPMVYVHLIITLALMFLFRYIPAPVPLTAYGMAVIGIFAGMIYGWATSHRGSIWISLAALVALGMTDFGNCSKAISTLFASDTAMLLLLGMLMVGPLVESNIGEWLLVKLLNSQFCYKKPWNFTILIIFGLGILSYVVRPIIIALFMIAVFKDLFAKVGYARGDKYPTMLLIGLFIAMLFMTAIFPWHGWGLYGTAAFAKSSGGYMIDYGKYVIIAVVTYCALTLGHVLLMKLMGCNVEPLREIDLSDMEAKYAAQGLSKHQKAVIIAFVGMALGSIFVSFAGGTSGVRLLISNINVYGVMLITLACMFFIRVEGQPIADIKICAKHVQWEMVLMIASALVLAGALTAPETGVSALMAKYAAPLLAGKGQYAFMIILAVITLLLTNIANNVAVMFVLMAVVGSFYSSGLITNAPAALLIITFATIMGFYTPASSAYGAMLHSCELVTSQSIYKYGALVMVFLVLVFAVVVVPLCYILF